MIKTRADTGHGQNAGNTMKKSPCCGEPEADFIVKISFLILKYLICSQTVIVHLEKCHLKHVETGWKCFIFKFFLFVVLSPELFEHFGDMIFTFHLHLMTHFIPKAQKFPQCSFLCYRKKNLLNVCSDTAWSEREKQHDCESWRFTLTEAKSKSENQWKVCAGLYESVVWGWKWKFTFPSVWINWTRIILQVRFFNMNEGNFFSFYPDAAAFTQHKQQDVLKFITKTFCRKPNTQQPRCLTLTGN